MDKALFDVFISGKFDRAVWAVSNDDAVMQAVAIDSASDANNYTAQRRHNPDQPGA